MDNNKKIYAGGFHGIVRKFEKKRQPFENPLEVLPPPDVDLMELAQQIIAPSDTLPSPALRYCPHSKKERLRIELEGQSELHLLHALLISMLRRMDPPDEAKNLFHRIWQETGKSFVKQLSIRWMIAAATTFADHGQTGDQRACGMGLSALFDMIKLHDSERRLSGRRNNRPFQQTKGAEPHSLAFDLRPYAIELGDLDRNLLARLWLFCEKDATIAPLGFHMLQLIMYDRRSIFARMQRLKANKRRQNRIMDSDKAKD